MKKEKINYRIEFPDTEQISLFMPFELLRDIRDIVRTKKDSTGGLKYGSRTHFIIVACKKLIEGENGN